MGTYSGQTWPFVTCGFIIIYVWRFVSYTVAIVKVHDCTGDNITYLWDFGDGTPTLTTTTPYVYHVFTQLGCYYVNNTAYNVISRRSSNLTLVCVEDELLDLNINTTLSGVLIPVSLVMTMSSGSDFLCYVWTGDGASYT